MSVPWADRFPERFKKETDALGREGIPYEIDGQALEAGRLVIHAEAKVGDETVRLRADYPDLFPYFRFEVFAPDLVLPHHQNPFSKNLCFIGRSTRNWNTDDTFAAYIKQRLPIVLEAGRSENREEVAEKELIQGEPISHFYQRQRNGQVLVESSWELPDDIEQGYMEVGVRPDCDLLVRGAVLRVMDESQSTLSSSAVDLGTLFPKKLHARWVRIDEPIMEVAAPAYLKELISQKPFIKKPSWQPVQGGKVDIIGVVFPEDLQHRATGDGWWFVVRILSRKKGFRNVMDAYSVRANRAGRVDLQARIPEVQGLENCTVALVGLGCIGAPSAIMLAQAGVKELRIMDGDSVDSGTIVRWPLGYPAIGLAKTDAISSYISGHYPYVKVRSWDHTIGRVPKTNDRFEDDLIGEFLGGADIILDATTEEGIWHYLSDRAAKLGIPYIFFSATPGGWGGRVVRFMPGRTGGCYLCFRYACFDESIPVPQSDPAELVQPIGCADPTFTGTSFNLMEVSLTATRLAVSTLLDGSSTSKGEYDWDVAVLALRSPGGKAILPSWMHYTIKKHPSCPICNLKR